MNLRAIGLSVVKCDSTDVGRQGRVVFVFKTKKIEILSDEQNIVLIVS